MTTSNAPTASGERDVRGEWREARGDGNEMAHQPQQVGLKTMLFTSLVSVGLFLVVFLVFLLIVSLLLSLFIPTYAKPDLDIAKPDFTGLYHTMDATLASVAHLVDSSKHLSIETMTRTATDEASGNAPTNESKAYKTTMTIVTYDEGRQRRDKDADGDGDQDAASDTDDGNRVLIDFGEHGREVITTETAMAFLAALASPAIRNGILSKFDLPPAMSAELADTLAHTVIKIIPIENTNGRTLVEQGHLCERKNGRGVDPNRNWGVDWGKKEPDYDPSEEYPGAFPFSEPEAQLLKEITESFRPDVFLNIHSGMEAMFVPWDHRLDVDYGVNVNGTLDMLHEIDATFCGGNCAVGAGGKEVGYKAHGTVTDYMHETLHVPIASTWEIFGDTEADFVDCWRMFNPLEAEEKDAVVERWVGSLFYAIWYALSDRHPVGRSKQSRERSRLGMAMTTQRGDGEQQMLVVYALLLPVVAAVVVGVRRRRGGARRGGKAGRERSDRDKEALNDRGARLLPV